jgi:two-component system, NarL family, nitrate/nitrite response regulator NarL
LAFRLGASGIFLKSDGPERLVQAIRLIHTGGVWIDQKTIRLLAEQCENSPRPMAHSPLAFLDEREQKVLLGILGGLTNSAIGTGMGISETSVKNTLQKLFAKTGVRKRSQLVRLAMEGSLGNGNVSKRQRANPMASALIPRQVRSQSLA